VKHDGGFDIVHAHTLRFFPDLVRDLGGNLDKLLQDVGTDPAHLASRRPPAGYRLIANLLEHAAAQLQCPDLGMRLAALQGSKVFGPLGLVMRNASTFGEGLAYVATHYHAHSLAAHVRLEQDRARRRVFVGHEILLEGLPDRRQAVEQALLLGHLNALEITGGQARAREVSFRLQPLSSLRTYRRYFGCDIRFDQCEDGVVFSERDLLCPTVEPNAQLFRMATSFIDTHFTRTKPPMQAQVRAVILQLLGIAKCTKERVAAELSLHPRTLCRRLQAEGKSFEKVKDEVRRDMALSYLRVTTLPLQRIAEKLGYAEHSVLTRSCSRWFAAAPSELRSRAVRCC
jgi:AraC-like DNA-binding protein